MKTNRIVVVLLIIALGLLLAQTVTADDNASSLNPDETKMGMATNISATASPTEGSVPLTVQFRDASRASLYLVKWDFGDGYYAYIRNPTHTYTKTGNFDVYYTARNEYGARITIKVATINVTNPPPVPVAIPTSGCAPLKVQFNGPSTDNTRSWAWNFGDGTPISALKNPVHTYNYPGTYNVRLTTCNSGGCRINPDIVTITVFDPPVSKMVVNQTGCIPFVIQCQDNSTGNPTSWLWEFGDGATSTDRNPVHTYDLVPVGPVTINLTVGSQCGTSTSSKSVTPNCSVIKLPAKIKVTSTDGQFPIPGANVSYAPYIMTCAPPPMLGCAFYPDTGNITYLGITDNNGILSTFVPVGYLEIIATRFFSDEDITCPDGGVSWTGKMTYNFGRSPDVTVNLTDSKYTLCV